MSFPNGTYDDQVDTLVDLVAKEVVKGQGFLHPMDVGNLPIKNHTYAEEILSGNLNAVHIDPLSIDDLLAQGKLNYRGKPQDKAPANSWTNGLF